jgi:hypothetical protein
MIKEKITILGEHIEFFLRRLCGKPSPEKRLITVAAVILFLAGINLYISVHYINNIVKNGEKKEYMQMEHIKQLEIQSGDSIDKQFKIEVYE